jgi:stage V sporulation protein S
MASQQHSVPVVLTPAPAAPSPARPVAGEAKALKVSASSRPTLVAGAIAGMVRERGRAEVQAIGAAAINQAVKAVAIARGYLAPSGVDLICVPGFIDVVLDDGERTAIRFLIEPR